MPKLTAREKGVKVKKTSNKEYPAAGNPKPNMSGLIGKRFGDRPREVDKEFQSKGAYRSHQVMRENKEKNFQNKTFADINNQILNGQCTVKQGIELVKRYYPDITNEEINWKLVLSIKNMERGLKMDAVGNNAFINIRDTIGEKPVDKQELTGSDGSPVFIEFKPYGKK